MLHTNKKLYLPVQLQGVETARQWETKNPIKAAQVSGSTAAGLNAIQIRPMGTRGEDSEQQYKTLDCGESSPALSYIASVHA